MKALLTIPVICTLYITTLDCTNKLYDTKIIIGTYPKKNNATLQKSIQLVNSRKLKKIPSQEYLKTKIKKNVEKNAHQEYTVFPPIVEQKIDDVPENYHFLGNIERKQRVKKVLPEYGIILLRKKRFVPTNVTTIGAINSIDNSKTVKHGKHIKKLIKRKRLNKSTRNEFYKNNKTKLKSKIIKSESDYVINKKKRNTNQTEVRTIKHSESESSSINHSKNRKNQTTIIYSERGKLGIKEGKKVAGEQVKKVRNRRLIAGRDAMIQDYPYVVSIQKGDRHWCAGALLNPRLVITTANCVWKSKSVSRMRVRAGSRHMERGGQLVKIQEVVKHPKWSIRSLPDNDVALLLLSKNIIFSDSVHAVDLPNRAMWPAFDDVWVASWGAERRDGIFQSVGVTLKVYHAMLLDHEQCNNVTMRFGVAVTNNFFCVAQTGRRAPCTRDTGAPAVSDGILWGVASWGIRKLCGTERYPSMFSYLASRSNLDFIANATHYLMSDKRHYPYGDRFVVNKADPTSTDVTTNLL